MKLLFCGLGSIGQRHLRNFIRLYGNNHEIMAFRVGCLQRTFTDNMEIREGISLEEEYNIRTFYNLNEALEQKPDIVFVTNVTSMHMETAIASVKAGCDVFIEKPLSDTTKQFVELNRAMKKQGVVVYVGFQNRFHPCITDIKNALEKRENSIGKIISVDCEFGERLVSMHTYEDYSKTYMARKELGGGPVLNLQIHALDYLQYLFGEPISVYSVYGDNSGLNINVEDSASSLYIFKGCNGDEYPVYSHTDFLQYPPAHRMKIVGNQGRIEVDFNTAKTAIFHENDSNTIEHTDFVRNDMFIDELVDFMACVSSRVQPATSINESLISLRMAVCSKLSAMEKRIVKLEEL